MWLLPELVLRVNRGNDAPTAVRSPPPLIDGDALGWRAPPNEKQASVPLSNGTAAVGSAVGDVGGAASLHAVLLVGANLRALRASARSQVWLRVPLSAYTTRVPPH